jgi:hypothetical protein
VATTELRGILDGSSADDAMKKVEKKHGDDYTDSCGVCCSRIGWLPQLLVPLFCESGSTTSDEGTGGPVK